MLIGDSSIQWSNLSLLSVSQVKRPDLLENHHVVSMHNRGKDSEKPVLTTRTLVGNVVRRFLGCLDGGYKHSSDVL